MDASDPTENLTWYNEEMEDYANGYAAYILEMVEIAKESCADPKVLIEQRVNFSRWVEQGFGTPTASSFQTAPSEYAITSTALESS